MQVEADVNIQDRHALIEAINVRLTGPVFPQEKKEIKHTSSKPKVFDQRPWTCNKADCVIILTLYFFK